MQVLGNGKNVSVNTIYDLPYIKVWTINESNIYWIQMPYEKAHMVIEKVRQVINQYGRKSSFWTILGHVLKTSFDSLLISDRHGRY